MSHEQEIFLRRQGNENYSWILKNAFDRMMKIIKASGLNSGWHCHQRANMRVSYIHTFVRVAYSKQQTYFVYTQCAILVQFLIIREIYKIIRESVQMYTNKHQIREENTNEPRHGVNRGNTKWNADTNQNINVKGKNVREGASTRRPLVITLPQTRWPRHLECFM